MKVLEIQGGSGLSEIFVNQDLERLTDYVPAGKRLIIVTDHNVAQFHRSRFPAGDVIEIGCGEGIKTLETVEAVYKQLLDLEADRSCYLIGIGGGVVCDIAGFVAATFMRGLPFGFVSSSLLSQVDASVGGKNGVNFHGYKNIIGLFQQPKFVICDLHMLTTLPQREVVNGCAEVVKHAAIGDKVFFQFLESHFLDILNLNSEVMEHVVHRCVQIKAAVVERDEREKGLRRILNFGHTFGHALESTHGVPHGEAVGLGMLSAAELSKRRGLLDAEDVHRLKRLLHHLGLPVSMSVDQEKIREALHRDKKREGDGIHFVLLKGIGDVVVEEIAMHQLEAVVNDLFKCC